MLGRSLPGSRWDNALKLLPLKTLPAGAQVTPAARQAAGAAYSGAGLGRAEQTQLALPC